MFIQTDVFIILLKLIYFSIVIIWSRFKLIKVLVSLDYCQNNNNKVRLYLLSYFLYAFPPSPYFENDNFKWVFLDGATHY